MRRTHANIRTIALAALAAGPIFLTCMTLGGLLDEPDETVSFGRAIKTLPLTIAFAIPAGIVGAIVAIVPAIVGAMTLTELGRHNEGTRLPAFWALIGGLMNGIPTAAFNGLDTIEGASLIATGALVAAICSRGIDWDRENRETAGPRKGLVRGGGNG